MFSTLIIIVFLVSLYQNFTFRNEPTCVATLVFIKKYAAVEEIKKKINF